MSRCTTPARWAASSPAPAPATICMAQAALSGPSDISCATDGPSTSSITRTGGSGGSGSR